MREIKFRAWDESIPMMRYFEPFKNTQPNMVEVEYVALNEIPLMQFTGLLDKHGKEVYEGDVVNFDNSEIGGKKYVGEIIWNSDQTLSGLEWGLWTREGYLKTDFLGTLEIIGNKFENPDLLRENT